MEGTYDNEHCSAAILTSSFHYHLTSRAGFSGSLAALE